MSESNNVPDLDHLQAGLVMLMDQYAETPCRTVAMAVAWRLECILGHPLIDLFPELQRQCARGLNRWRARMIHSPEEGLGFSETLH